MIPYAKQAISEQDIAAVTETLRSDIIAAGPKVEEFEKALCDYIGCKYAVAVNSGTSALDIAIQSLCLPRGSEVITTPFTFVATPNALLYNGLTPVFVDIEKDTRNIDPEKIEEKITKKTRAILSVDYAGHPCDYGALWGISNYHNLHLIEDGCHALGAEYWGHKVGTLADMTCFSFHPVKLITTGEGGAVVTDNEERAKRLRMLRNHGINKTFSERTGYEYDMKILGRNYRMSDINVTLGISQLKSVNTFLTNREAVVSLYNNAFENNVAIETPVARYVRHAWHIYTILLSGIERDAFYAEIRKKGIGVNVHYIPAYRMSYYIHRFHIDPADFPVTEDVFKRIVTLPLYPSMSVKNAMKVIDAVTEVLEEK